MSGILGQDDRISQIREEEKNFNLKSAIDDYISHKSHKDMRAVTFSPRWADPEQLHPTAKQGIGAHGGVPCRSSP